MFGDAFPAEIAPAFGAPGYGFTIRVIKAALADQFGQRAPMAVLGVEGEAWGVVFWATCGEVISRA